MESSFLFDTINLGWSIVYIDGSQVIFSKSVFTLVHSVDPDEIVHHAAFHLRLHCLPKYAFKLEIKSSYSVKKKNELILTGPGSAVGNMSDCR